MLDEANVWFRFLGHNTVSEQPPLPHAILDSCVTNRREDAMTNRSQSHGGSSFDVSQACIAF